MTVVVEAVGDGRPILVVFDEARESVQVTERPAMGGGRSGPTGSTWSHSKRSGSSSHRRCRRASKSARWVWSAPLRGTHAGC